MTKINTVLIILSYIFNLANKLALMAALIDSTTQDLDGTAWYITY